MLEAELKASLGGLTAEEVADRAVLLGFLPEARVQETDVYFNGRERDFRRRRCSLSGERGLYPDYPD